MICNAAIYRTSLTRPYIYSGMFVAIEVAEASMAYIAKMTFTTVTTTSDRAVTLETLFSEASGQLERETVKVADSERHGPTTQGFVFYPDRVLSGVDLGMKANDGSVDYQVLYVETFDDHQEIHLRKVK